MNQGFVLIIGSILIWFCFIAFFTVIEGLFQTTVEKCREIAEGSLGKSFWLGVVNTIFFVVLVVLFFFLSQQTGVLPLALPGVILAILFLVGVIIGLSAMIQLIGDRIFSNLSGFRKKGYAAGLTILGCLTPIVGWYGLLPYLVLVGFGAFVARTYNEYRERRKQKE